MENVPVQREISYINMITAPANDNPPPTTSVDAYLSRVRIFTETLDVVYYSIVDSQFLSGEISYNPNLVGLDTDTIVLTTSADLNPATVIAANIRLAATAAPLVNLLTNNEISLYDNIIYLDVTSLLAADTQYQLTITTDVEGTDDEVLASNVVIPFRTQRLNYEFTVLYDEDFSGLNNGDIAGQSSYGETWTTVHYNGAAGATARVENDMLRLSYPGGGVSGQLQVNMRLEEDIDVIKHKIITVESRLKRTGAETLAASMDLPAIFSGAGTGGAHIQQNVRADSTTGYFRTHTNNPESMRFESDTWYNVRMVMNFATNTVDMYVNNLKILTNGTLRNNNLTTVRQLRFLLQAEDNLYIDRIRITGGVAPTDLIFEEQIEVGGGVYAFVPANGVAQNIRVTAMPESGFAANSRVILAVYDINGDLIDIAVSNAGNPQVSIDLTALGGNEFDYHLAAYVWNVNMNPYILNSLRTLNVAEFQEL